MVSTPARRRGPANARLNAWLARMAHELPLLAGLEGEGWCSHCGNYAAQRYLLYVPAYHGGTEGCVLHRVCAGCLSLTPHRPMF